MVATRRLNELAEQIEKQARWPRQPFFVALSGGADSATLAAVASAGDGLTGCIHVDHGLAASDDLAAAATAVAAKIGSRLETVTVSVPEGPSPEAQARSVRYQALAGAAGETAVLLGHTLDDVGETFLINLVRGSGVRGLSGIPFHRAPNFYRPFLNVGRSQTREYALLAGLPFLDDPTNFDTSIRRNEIRIELLPRLEKMNPAIGETLARTAENLLAEADFLDSLTPPPGSATEGGSVQIPIGLLIALPPPLRWRALSDVARLRGTVALTGAELSRIDRLLAGDASAVEIEGGIRIVRSGPMLEAVVAG